MTLIKANNLSVSFGSTQVMKSVDFELREGEVVGLIGANGAGKSTLMRSLAGLLNYEGTVQLFDQKVSQRRPKSISKAISYLAQTRDIHWPLTVRRVIALGRLPHLQPWQDLSKEDESIIQSVMSEVGITHLEDRVIDELAGGEKALVLLARALVNQPKVILADEPVAGLDPNHQMQVMQLLRSRIDADVSSLVVLHDLSLAAQYCDRLYFIHEGKVLADGAPKEVLSDVNLAIGYQIEIKLQETERGLYVLPWRRL